MHRWMHLQNQLLKQKRHMHSHLNDSSIKNYKLIAASIDRFSYLQNYSIKRVHWDWDDFARI